MGAPDGVNRTRWEPDEELHLERLVWLVVGFWVALVGTAIGLRWLWHVEWGRVRPNAPSRSTA